MTPLDRLIESLPQKAPFLFLDEILEHAPGVRARGAKTFPAGHPVFENHLPGEPLVPGVILLEALAQLSAVVCVGPDRHPVRGYLAGIEAMRFRRLVRPGERIELESSFVRRFGTVARFEVRAAVDGAEAAGGILTIGGIG